jgi:hypothetical protein
LLSTVRKSRSQNLDRRREDVAGAAFGPDELRLARIGLEDFLPHFAGWKFGFVDLPALFRSTERILEYPMVDRDPVEGWSFGRVTLLGDAAQRLPATAAVVRSNRRFGPERVLQMVEERIRGPEDDIASVVTREELDEITRGYRRIAGFDVEILNRKADETRERVAEFAHGEARSLIEYGGRV